MELLWQRYDLDLPHNSIELWKLVGETYEELLLLKASAGEAQISHYIGEDDIRELIEVLQDCLE